MRLKDWKYIFVGVLLCSCSVSEKRMSETDDMIAVKSLVEQYGDSILLKPDVAINAFSELKEKLTDTIQSYTLLLQIAKCYFNLNDVERSFALTDQVLEFCNNLNIRHLPPPNNITR